ncbi:MAG: hypothetical protein HYV08_15005 [Deltaproteobacteria bacterium]|nr:hypothetical protein [Deltaproteobacteria bacterium]MBI3076036.1 hypothetical protein [Deltaproteobacteria bacterium]
MTTLEWEEIATEARLGVRAVRRGFVTKEQVIEAMRRQVEEDLEGRAHRRIGEILCELGYLNRSQLEELLGESAGRPK